MPRIAVPVVTAFALALLAAGCGGGGKAPGVATLAAGAAAPATTTTQSGPGPAVKTYAGPAGGSARGQFRLSTNTGSAANGEKFSVCMRKHGVPNYPDPNGQGVITIDSGMGIDPGSPSFQSAQAACRKVLPNGGRPTPAQIAKQQRQLLAFSACMRAHGVKDFPDPSNGGLRIAVHPGSDLDPNSPTFQKAQQACRKNLPFKGG